MVTLQTYHAVNRLVRDVHRCNRRVATQPPWLAAAPCSGVPETPRSGWTPHGRGVRQVVASPEVHPSPEVQPSGSVEAVSQRSGRGPRRLKNILYSQRAAPYLFISPFVITLLVFWMVPLA